MTTSKSHFDREDAPSNRPSNLVARLRSPLVTFEDRSLRHAEALTREAADEIERLTAERKSQYEVILILERERREFRAALVAYGEHSSDCATHGEQIGRTVHAVAFDRCDCGLQAALDGLQSETSSVQSTEGD